MEKWIWAAAALTCCACTTCMDGEDDRMVKSVVRRSGTTEVFFSSGDRDSVDVFVYDDDVLRRLDTYQRTVITDGKVKVASTSGAKILAFVMNGRQGRYFWTANNSYSYIEGLEAEFIHDRSSSPVMGGWCRTDGKTGKAEAYISPIMSRIVLRSLRCDFTGRAYEGEELTDVRVYLTNVSSVCRVIKTEDFVTRGTLNTGRLCDEDLALMDEPSMLYGKIQGSIGKESVDVGRELFCYPNTNESEGLGTPFTRLVIEGKIEGNTWYWPININREDICWVEGTPGVGRGCSYVYDVTIRRTGSTDPDIPVKVGTVEINGIIEAWAEEDARNEVF